MTYGDAKDHFSGLLHGVDIDDIEGIDLIFERAANTLLAKIDPVDTIRNAALTQTIHDDIYNYALPSDFKGFIDLIPQDGRGLSDIATRKSPATFDLRKAIASKVVSIEASEGTKYARINWRSRSGLLFHGMNTLTENGTWSAVATATGLQANSIFKISGSASIEFDIVTTGDGIQNTTMTAVDLTDYDEVADFFVWMYFGAVPTSVSARWGNDLTTNYWSSIAQTAQADGTAFKVGWNLIKFPWSTATETGTVAPATIDSFRITVASSAQNNVRVDNIMVSIGRNFNIKYYSKFLFKNSAGTFITKPTTDSDTIILDNDAIQMFLLECVIAGAWQIESSNAEGDMSRAKIELNGDSRSPDPSQRMGLYAKYKKEYPSERVKVGSAYGGLPARGRW